MLRKSASRGRAYRSQTPGGMPELSRFFGIVIRMFTEVGVPHHQPHFHAYYQGHSAVLGIHPVECLGGFLPPAQLSLVHYWAALHEDELLRDWERLQSGRAPFKIEPLR